MSNRKHTSKRIQMHFAHANGFPSGSYQQMFAALPNHIDVLAKPKFAHSEHFKQDKNWHTLVHELIEYCEKHADQDKPLWAVGHSMGAIVSFKAYCERPDLFAGLIMFDPPLVTGPLTGLVNLVKRTKYIDKISPASLSATRKSRWHKNDDMLRYFKGKALFSGFKDDCIEDYVKAATKVEGDTRVLSFKAEIEAQLFRHVPDDLNRFKAPLNLPGALVTGQHSNV